MKTYNKVETEKFPLTPYLLLRLKRGNTRSQRLYIYLGRKELENLLKMSSTPDLQVKQMFSAFLNSSSWLDADPVSHLNFITSRQTK